MEKYRKVMQKVHKRWLRLSIHKKIGIFVGIAFLMISVAVITALWLTGFLMNDLQRILEDNAKSIDYIDGIEHESKCFVDYIKNPEKKSYDALEKAKNKTEELINLLPFDYSSIGLKRYAKTWSIKNSYQVYQKQRDTILKMDESYSGYIKELYEIYDMQKYLQEYGRSLMRDTLEYGSSVYEKKEKLLKFLPLFILILECLLISGLIRLAHLLNQSIMAPIMKLVKASYQIASNDFYVEDVAIENEDELGNLVQAFNKMKYATGQYISTLEEQKNTLALLHQEELEKLEIQNRLERTKFRLLRSQINPHFLFNTLNVIGGMAELEEAYVTQKMIQSLSNLFRYNLKNEEMQVLLSQELLVVQDYLYLQKMRFGMRIEYKIMCEVDPESVIVPSFLFQPLVENAIIHGISRKEEGGRVRIKIKDNSLFLVIIIADTGAGMSKKKLQQLRKGLSQEETNGIGINNVYQRLHRMSQESEMSIHSKENTGTIISIKIPKIKGDKTNASCINC